MPPSIVGGRRPKAYAAWINMRQRCENAKHAWFHRYGGRGIRVCDRWQTYANFIADMGMPGEGQQLDRIDNDRGYEPTNCRWTTPTNQARNRSTTKLQVADKDFIMHWHNTGHSMMSIARAFNIVLSCVQGVISGRTWR